LTLAAGEITADVQGSRRAPYKVRVRVRPFSEEEWDRVLDALAAEIGHTAALLEGELPPGVSDDVRSVGLDLLPGAGELQPRCSCPDWADPCKHAAAVCFLVADALDADPFGVLLLRGLGREEVLAGLRSRRHANASVPPSVPSLEPEQDVGVLAKGAWARDLQPLPAAPPPPRRPGRPAVLAADPPPGSGVDLRRCAPWLRMPPGAPWPWSTAGTPPASNSPSNKIWPGAPRCYWPATSATPTRLPLANWPGAPACPAASCFAALSHIATAAWRAWLS
jgi:hypothetical protein